MRRFAVSLADEILIVPESEVYCFLAKDKGVNLCTYDKEYPFEMTLKELEQSLDPERFVRVHKSSIVAIDKVRKLERWFHGDLVLQLEDKRNRTLRVGRNYRDRLRPLLGNF